MGKIILNVLDVKRKKINGFDKISFKEAYSTNEEFLQKGNYITHINEYLNIFKRSTCVIYFFLFILTRI